MARLKIYLAGPDVFLPDAEAILEAKCDLCTKSGFEGVSPLDGPAADSAMAIFAKCEAAMDRADAVLANMTPFRGPGMDAGTAYEVGYMRARGKPVFGYSNAPGAYAARIPDAQLGPAGRLVDGDGVSVEDFGLPENLMPVGAAAAFSQGVATPRTAPADPYRDLAAFVQALRAIGAWVAATPL